MAKQFGDYELNLKISHVRPQTIGKVVVKGVAEKGARVKVTGLVSIEEKAVDSDSSLVMKMLLLDKKSTVQVDPKMEIMTNRVKASHSAAVSRIDEEQLFYLESRGIDRHEAEKMIIKGFLKK